MSKCEHHFCLSGNSGRCCKCDKEIVLAENLITTAKWHKKQCKDTECNVSLFMLGRVYSQLIGRELNKREFKIFI